jgi:hypothetical protein
VLAVQVFSGVLEDELRRELVYGGDLLIFRGVEPASCGECRMVDQVWTP